MKVVIADSADLIREGLSSILKGTLSGMYPELSIYEAENQENLLFLVSSVKPEIVILESAMVQDDMNDKLVNLVKKFPSVHWVLLSESIAKVLLLYVRDHSNFSIIRKSSPKEEIQSAIRMAIRGQQLICSDAMKELLALSEDGKRKNAVLTPSECIVLALLAQGLKVKDIAVLQCRSKHTIRTHKRDIFEKLGVNTTVEAIMTAYKLGIINPPDNKH